MKRGGASLAQAAKRQRHGETLAEMEERYLAALEEAERRHRAELRRLEEYVSHFVESKLAQSRHDYVS